MGQTQCQEEELSVGRSKKNHSQQQQNKAEDVSTRRLAGLCGGNVWKPSSGSSLIRKVLLSTKFQEPSSIPLTLIPHLVHQNMLLIYSLIFILNPSLHSMITTLGQVTTHAPADLPSLSPLPPIHFLRSNQGHLFKASHVYMLQMFQCIQNFLSPECF